MTFADCEKADELLALTKAALADAVAPKVSYEVDVALIDGGVPVRLGDEVAVIDSSRSPEWRLTAHVVKRKRELSGFGRVCSVTLGTAQRKAAIAAAEVAATVATVTETAAMASDAVKAMNEVDLGEVAF